MTIRVEDDIKELMYEASSIVIPGLGAFQGKYKAASTDGIQGNIAPPSLDITFDPNVVINDGVLVDCLKKKYQISTQTAQKAIDAFTDNANVTFEKHELVIIPEVGRLYRDFTNKIQFLPDTTNFNIDTFGLPVAQFYPVSRTNTEKTAAVEAIFGEAEPPAQKGTFPETTDNIPFPNLTEENLPIAPTPAWRKYIPYATVGVLALLILAIYNNSQSKREASFKAAQESIKINVPPPKPTPDVPQPPIAATPPAQEQPIAHEKMTELPNNSANGTDNTTLSATVPKQKLLVMLGGYADKKNIARHIKWITDNGYGLYQKQGNNMTLLGAEVSYENKEELKKMLRNMRGRFGEAVQIKGKI
jgi:CCDC81-like prokaryotic HU domain 1/CCDC81-like prokaryotic HU domain 2